MQPIEIEVGQIAILDDAILHYSGNNKSNKDRGTIQLIMTPKSATTIHYYCPDVKKGEIEVYKTDKEFFTNFNMHAKPEGVPLLSKIAFTHTPIKNEKSFAALIGL